MKDTKFSQELPGDRIREITTINVFKTIMVDLFRGYPAWKYFGIIETYFPEDKMEKILKILEYDEMIVTEKIDNKIYYRLKGKGLDFAISMINLEISEKMLKYTKSIKILTWIMVGVACLTFLVSMFNFPFIQRFILSGAKF